MLTVLDRVYLPVKTIDIRTKKAGSNPSLKKFSAPFLLCVRLKTLYLSFYTLINIMIYNSKYISTH